MPPTPAVVILPILLAVVSVNHRLPPGPAAIMSAPLPPVWIGYSVSVPWAEQTIAAATRIGSRLSGPVLGPVSHKLPRGLPLRNSTTGC